MLRMVFVALVLIGIWLLMLAFGSAKKLRKYEFENRTSGGVVGFPDFEAAERHRKSRSKNQLIGKMGVLTFAVGVMGSVLTTVYYLNQAPGQ